MQSSKVFSFVWILCGPLRISWCIALLLHATEGVCQNSRFDILDCRFTISNCIAFINYISLDDLLLIFIQWKHSSYDGLYCATFYVFQQEVFASLFSRYRTCFRNRNKVSGLWLIRRYKFRFFQVSRSCLLLLIFVAITWKELLKFHFGVWQFFISQLKPIVSFE